MDRLRSMLGFDSDGPSAGARGPDADGGPPSGTAIDSPQAVKAVVQGVSPTEFDLLVADLWGRLGWTTEALADGRGVVATRPRSSGETRHLRTVVASKEGPLGPDGLPPLDADAEAEAVVVVTPNDVTATARDRLDDAGIELVDGDEFVTRLAEGEGDDLLIEHVPHVDSVADTDDEAATAGPPIPWVWFVILATGFWLAYIVVGDALGDLSLYLLVAPAWGLLPVSIYFDARDLRERTGWPPRPMLYVIAAFLPVIGSISGIIYLLRRYRRTRRQATSYTP